MTIVRKCAKYFFLFLFFLFVLIFFGYNNTDIIWNYGFSHAIRIGEIPYHDFNLIATPLYAFIMSVGLWIFDSYLVFLIEQSILCTVLYALFEKMFSKNANLIIVVLCFPIFYTIFPNYNFLVFFLIVVLLYLENYHPNDVLIGFVLGLLVLSKHTVGGVITLCSIIACFDIKRAGKRCLGFSVPLFCFLVYLLITGSFTSFIDLSVLGLFDFGDSNGSFGGISIFLAAMIFFHFLVLFRRNWKDKNLYYLLGAFSFVIPICDFFHFNYLIAVYMVVLLLRYQNSIPDLRNVTWILLSVLVILNIILNYSVYEDMKFCSFDHFEGYLTTQKHEKYMKKILKSYSHSNNAYMYSFSNMFFDIASNHKITYFDVPLYGNFGYHGISKMKSIIDQMHGVYFYIDSYDNIQFAKEIYDYIKEKGTSITSDCGFEIFYNE